MATGAGAGLIRNWAQCMRWLRRLADMFWVRVYEAATWKPVHRFPADAGQGVWTTGLILAFSPDGRFLGYVRNGAAAYVWDLRTGAPRWTVEAKDDDLDLRRLLAEKAFARTAAYDAAISHWFSCERAEIFPDETHNTVPTRAVTPTLRFAFGGQYFAPYFSP